LEDLDIIVRTLTIHNLAIELLLPVKGEVWKDVNELIASHFKLSGVEVATAQRAPVSGPVDRFFLSQMILIMPSGPLGGDSRIFKQTSLVSANFTADSLTALSKRVPNPLDGDVRPILFFGPHSQFC
jgi:hypothetical protein